MREGPPRFAELFAGAGGLSLGLERAGWECAWHAENAVAPRAILEYRWPQVPLYGDVLAIDGRELTAKHGPIDLLSGGSPCQDLSVAGKRAGMTEGSGTRSSLFFEQMRLWDETGADLCLWENVDGARSSNEGKDFGAVLRAFVGAAIAVPSDGWRSAGVAAGPLGVAAWRILDAQFFGVPQRRRRVFVLGTRTGRVDPAEVLSLAESVRGDSPKGREAGEGSPDSADEGVEPTSGVGIFDALNSTTDDIAHSLRSNMDRASGYGAVIAFGQQNSAAQGASASASASAKCAPTLDKSKVPGVISFDWQKGNDVNNPRPSTLNVRRERTDPLRAGNVPAVLSIDGEGNATENISGVLQAHHSSHNRGAICVTGEITHSLTHDGHDGSEDGTGRGTPVVLAFNEEVITSPVHRGGLTTERTSALTPAGRTTVFNETGHEKWTDEAVAGSLTAHEAREAHTLIAGTLESRENGGGFPGTDGALGGHVQAPAGIPRRLTPRECERLMGWPDDHTLVPLHGKLLSDAARYKACGNGVASVHSHWIGWRLKLALES